MVKVLVVHDREDALTSIRSVVEAQGVRPHLIEEAKDGIGARSQLSRESFDLVIFDLTIPPVHGRSDPSYSTAEDIFLELYHGDGLNAPGDMIGITREASALATINLTIGPHLMAVVEETKGDEWKAQLADRVQYTMRSTEGRVLAATRRYDYDVAIITALDKEMRPFEDLFSMSDVRHFRGAKEFVFHDSTETVRRGVAFSVGSAGQAGCASATQALIARFRPKAFFLSGFCGGYRAQTRPGQVALFRTVYDWDSGKWDDPSARAQQTNGATTDGPKPTPLFLPRPDPIAIGNGEASRVVRTFADQPLREHAALLKEVQGLSKGEIDTLKFAPSLAASGSAVVGDAAVLARIRKQHDQIEVVDMESYGFYEACSTTPFARPEMLCVKAVADFCDGEKHDRLHSSCCIAAAKTVEDIMLYRWRFDGAQ